MAAVLSEGDAVFRAVRIASCVALSLIASGIASAQAPTAPAQPARNAMNMTPQEIPLWEGGAPGALGDTDADKPTLTIYRAARVANGTGVVVAPGGGYGALAMDHEGRQVAA